MLLSQLTLKNVYVRETPKAICLGVGISLKNYAVKYLLCNSISPQNTNFPNDFYADFCVNASAFRSLTDTALTLSALRPVFPKSCAKIFMHRPVYSYDGSFLGTVQDMEIVNFTATRLFTEKNVYPVSAVCAVSDAILLRKEQTYPLGQRIPAPVVAQIFNKNEPLVTKSVLRTAIAKSALIKLTLSLPPFYCPLPERGDHGQRYR